MLSFDPAKWWPLLIPGGRPSINPDTLAPSLGELRHVALIFSDICSLITNYLPVNPVHRPSTASIVHQSPSAPTATVTSPTLYTPLLLSRFLQYSWDHLGVSNAISYENALLQHGYGLDILHKVPSKDLENLGISAGNVIQLKEACLPYLQDLSQNASIMTMLNHKTQAKSHPHWRRDLLGISGNGSLPTVILMTQPSFMVIQWKDAIVLNPKVNQMGCRQRSGTSARLAMIGPKFHWDLLQLQMMLIRSR